jgi:predicted RNase H-like HicB family nuclease
MAHSEQAEYHVVLTLQFEREGKHWVGACVELGTSTFARSIERAQRKLRELVVLHLNALEEEGERERFFEEHGIEIHRKHEQAHDLIVKMPLGRTEEVGPLFEPYVFPLAEPAEQLATAGV